VNSVIVLIFVQISCYFSGTLCLCNTCQMNGYSCVVLSREKASRSDVVTCL